MFMDSKSVELEACITSQIPTNELINYGSLETLVNKKCFKHKIITKKYTRLYRSQVILSATLMALFQIWRINK